ncbi:hypothetical protein R9C00_27310 [Flammeovirgaceae bacterium SG7u.111]|nr:hypothetical protein [Flammeovirgaceae bacterium SG7u.132]WPO35410.1 hypothetical protein R9C00_27310 [Flammeovirgaceae bacterium SG7u.111]
MDRLFLVATCLLFLSGLANATDPDSTKTRPAQITFVYPLGSNGFDAMDYSNKFSLNVLFGLNGGLDGGTELAGIASYNHGDVSGFQAAGMFNVNKGKTEGAIMSGLANLSGGDSRGALFAGYVNATNGSSKGLQSAGFANVTLKSFNGAGFAGFTNVVLDSASGFMGAGFANVVTNNASGVHISPFNVTTKRFDGFQLGVVNYASTLSGTQLGIINVVTDLEKGVPIGLFSVVKGGLFEIEVLAGEALYSNLNYKMGVDQFYTIFKAGFATYKDKSVVSYGAGFGTNVSLGARNVLSIDLSSSQLNYDNNWDGKVNLLNKLDFNFKIALSDHVSFILGPSLNVYVTQEKVDGEFGTLNVPYTLYEDKDGDTGVSGWIGGNAGVSFRF